MLGRMLGLKVAATGGYAVDASRPPRQRLGPQARRAGVMPVAVIFVTVKILLGVGVVVTVWATFGVV